MIIFSSHIVDAPAPSSKKLQNGQAQESKEKKIGKKLVGYRKKL